MVLRREHVSTSEFESCCISLALESVFHYAVLGNILPWSRLLPQAQLGQALGQN